MKSLVNFETASDLF